MDYFRICAIDAGTRNFAFCVIDNVSWRDPLVWRKQDLWPPKCGRKTRPTTQDIVQLTRQWVADNRGMLDGCDMIVLEKQMRTPFIVQNAVIQTLMFEKCVEVHPVSVGAWWKLPRRREAKKEAGVVQVQHYATIPPNMGKPDDLADAWLMAVYMMVRENVISQNNFSETRV